MSRELLDEPELVHRLVRMVTDMRLDQSERKRVIDLCCAIFDAGIAHGLVLQVHPSPQVKDAIEKVRKIIESNGGASA